MIFILRFDCKRVILFIVIATLVSIFLIFSVNASVSLFSSAINPNELTDGIYNIVNSSTGQYLDVYDFVYEQNGRAYVTTKSGNNGQDFLIKRQDDGTYIIYPQSENGVYSLSYEFDIMEGEFISKKENVSNQSKFNIVQTENDSLVYVIKPTSMSDSNLSLGITSTKSLYDFSLVGFSPESDSPEQKWQFVKVSSESLLISGGYVDVKLGTTHSIYTKLTPSHLIGNLVWESSNPEIASVDSNGIVYGVSEGKTVITVTCGNKSASTVVNVTPLTAFTWYSQHNMESGGWYAQPLENLYLTTTAGTKKLFFSPGYANDSDWLDSGCKLCSEAMVLHNLGATLSEGYDIRTGKENNLEADPYTVALANSGVSGKNIATGRVYNSPILVNHHLINPRFTVDGKAVTTTEYSGGSLTRIKALLEKHPEGVVVGMYNSYANTTHYVVFTECLNPDASDGNYEFRICDSAASTPELGDNVPFKESISCKNLGYSYSSIFVYSVYNIAK